MRRKSIGAVAGLLFLGVPRVADACSANPCSDTGTFLSFSIANETLSTDGVLLIEAMVFPGLAMSADEADALVELTVTDGRGSEIKGVLDGVPGVYVWRPLDPLVAGDLLTVDFAVSQDNCYGPFDGSTTVTVIDESPPALVVPTVAFEQGYRLEEQEDLDALVCCDGAYPYIVCEIPPTPWTDAGYCVTATGLGYAEATLDVSDFDAALASTTRIDLVVNGKVAESRGGANVLLNPIFTVSRIEAFEVTTRIVDVATGDELPGEVFTADGGGLGEPGLQPLDADVGLRANCQTAPYVCEHDGSAWIETACTPYWDDEAGSSTTDAETDIGTSSGSGGADAVQDASGCGCTGGGTPTTSAVMLMGLLGLRRRQSSAPRPN